MGNGFNELIKPASNFSDPEQAFRACFSKDRLNFISVRNVEVCFFLVIPLLDVFILGFECESEEC